MKLRLSLPFSLAAIFLVAIFGVATWWWLYGQQRYEVRVAPGGHVQIRQREGTDEQPVTPAQKEAYTVAPDRPRFLIIGKIGVHARILQLGLTDKGEVAAPQGIWDTAWYDGSAAPGNPGTSFIDGHISGPTLPAVFVRLNQLVAGDAMTVERGNGEQLHYIVQTVSAVRRDAVDMATVLGPHGTNVQSLVLMTCQGQFDAKQYSYDSRLIVVATRV